MVSKSAGRRRRHRSRARPSFRCRPSTATGGTMRRPCWAVTETKIAARSVTQLYVARSEGHLRCKLTDAHFVKPKHEAKTIKNVAKIDAHLVQPKRPTTTKIGSQWRSCNNQCPQSRTTKSQCHCIPMRTLQAPNKEATSKRVPIQYEYVINALSSPEF